MTGLMYCADCGGKMYVHRTYNGKRVPQYTCGQYGKYRIGSLCPTQHRIKAEAVLTLITDMLRAIAEYSRNDRAEFIRTVRKRRPPSRPPIYPRSGNGWPPPKSGPGNWKS